MTSLSEKNKKAKKIMTLDKHTIAYDAFDIEPDSLTRELEVNKKAQDEDLTPGQKSLVWEKKGKEVYSVHLFNITEDEPVEVMLPDYYSEGEAIKAAIECLIAFDPTDDVIEATIFVGEYEDEKGDVYGEPIDIYTISNQDKETTMQARKKAGFVQLEVNRYLGEALVNEAESKEVEFEVPGFWGFYESLYTSESDLEYTFFNDPSAIDEHLMELFDDFRGREMEWSIDKDFVDTVSKAYVETFDSAMKDAIPSWKGSTYVETESPKEYNYTSDRIFAKTVIDDAVAQEIGQFLEEHKAEFEAMVKSRFTSYDGFISFYSNDASSEDWQKELVDMDHNELSTVFMAILETEKGEDIFEELNEVTYEYLRGNAEDYDYFLYDRNYDALVEYINANAVMKPALDDLRELEKYLPTGEKENGLPVYELDLHDQPGQQHLDFSKVESLNRKAREVLAMNEISDELARKSMRMRGHNMALAQSDEKKASEIVSYANHKKDKEFINAAKKNYDRAFNDRIAAEKKYDRNARLNISRDRRRETRLSESEMTKKIQQFQDTCYYALNNIKSEEKQIKFVRQKYPELQIKDNHFVLPGCCAVRIR